MTSIWTVGTRVRVIADDPTRGWVGTVHSSNYAKWLTAAAVVLDNDPEQQPAFYVDEELEEVE
ncbi:hypothetical protein ACIPYS_17945 [Kitasatospora sp. NPDC089913]|uniref:hypothetical protein n=1 Tax=Kitasatospora sp. NPDC089913 TaxID=3364080 RepID=UPI003808DC21